MKWQQEVAKVERGTVTTGAWGSPLVSATQGLFYSMSMLHRQCLLTTPSLTPATRSTVKASPM